MTERNSFKDSLKKAESMANATRIIKETLGMLLPVVRVQVAQTTVMFRLKSYHNLKAQHFKEDAVISIFIGDVS